MQEERDDLLAHVEHCLTCSIALEEAKAQSAYIRGARSSVSAPDSLRNAVTLKLQDAARAGSGPRIVQRNSSLMRVWSLTAVAAILLVVAGCVFTFNRQMQKRNNLMIHDGDSCTSATRTKRDASGYLLRLTRGRKLVVRGCTHTRGSLSCSLENYLA